MVPMPRKPLRTETGVELFFSLSRKFRWEK